MEPTASPQQRGVLGQMIISWVACVWVAMSFPCRAAETTPLIATYDSVRTAFLRESFEEVTTLAQSFVHQSQVLPDEVARVRCWWALSLDRLQRPHEALKVLDVLKTELSADDPFWAEVLFWEGEISRRAFQMVRARLSYQQLLERAPRSIWAAQARVGLGKVLIHEQALTEALEQFQTVAAQKENQTLAQDAALLEGFCLVQLKRFQQATRVLQDLLDRSQNPDTVAQVAFYLGESLTGLDRFEQAQQAYQRSIDVKPDSPWAWASGFGLGWVQYQSGDCEACLHTLERYLTPTTKDRNASYQTEARFAQAGCLMRLGREPEALTLFERILSDDFKHPLALQTGLTLVDIYRRHGDILRAVGVLESLSDRPLDPIPRAQLQLKAGSIALDQGQFLQARRFFKLASEVGQLAIRQVSLAGLADVEMFLGNVGQAQVYYEQGITLSPQTPEAAYASYQLGRLNLESGSFDQAMEIFQRLTSSTDASIAQDAALALALAHVRRGENRLARGYLQALAQQQGNPTATARTFYYLALLAIDEADEESASAFCQQTIQGAPDSEEALEARLLLAELTARQSTDASVQELQRVYATEKLPLRHRARVAQRLGDITHKDGRYAEAIRWYEIAYEVFPNIEGELGYSIASCYEEAADIELAIHRYQKLKQAPWRVRGQLAAARLLERQNQLDQAKAIYIALAQEPIPEAKVLQERLAFWDQQTWQQPQRMSVSGDVYKE